MFSIGDQVFYGAHGVCVIEDIQEQSFLGQKKDYYVLSSKQNDSLQLYYPVETEQSKLAPLVSEEQAERILDIFKKSPGTWPERATERNQQYQKILESNDHLKVAQMINTVMRKKFELEQIEKKLPSHDAQTLNHVLSIFCEEMSLGLGLSVNEVTEKIEAIILEN